MDPLIVFLQALISGVSIGCIYALVALGFVLIYKATEVVNFAQGELMMVGAFFAYTVIDLGGIPFLPGVLLALIAAAAFGGLLNRFLLRPLIGSPATTMIQATVAVSTLLRRGDQGAAHGERRASHGRGLHPAVGHRSLPLLFALRCGAAVAALAGILLAPAAFVDANMGSIALKAFPAAVLGGFGNLPGTMASGLVIGVIEELAGLYPQEDQPRGRAPPVSGRGCGVLVHRARPGAAGCAGRPPPYYLSQLVLVGIVIAGAGLMLLCGYRGQISLGQTCLSRTRTATPPALRRDPSLSITFRSRPAASSFREFFHGGRSQILRVGPYRSGKRRTLPSILVLLEMATISGICAARLFGTAKSRPNGSAAGGREGIGVRRGGGLIGAPSSAIMSAWKCRTRWSRHSHDGCGSEWGAV